MASSAFIAKVTDFRNDITEEVGSMYGRMLAKDAAAPNDFIQFVLRLLRSYDERFGLEGGHVTCDDVLDALRGYFDESAEVLHEAKNYEGEAELAKLWSAVESYLYCALLVDDRDEMQ